MNSCMNISKGVRNVAGVVLAAALVTGCSSIADQAGEAIAEEGVEQGMEAAGGGDVEIESDGEDNVTIESDEGSMEFTGGELPEDFPEEIPVPGGFAIESSMGLETAEGQMFRAHFTSPDAQAEQIHDELRSRLEDAGFESTATNSMSANGVERRVSTLASDDWVVNLVVNGEQDLTSVIYSVTTPDESQ